MAAITMLGKCALILSVTAGSAVVLSGCASMREHAARQKLDLMIAAGFTARPATTPQAQQELASLPPLQMSQFVKGNEFVYVFPDPKGCNCVYVGNQTQYSQYRKLAFQQRIAEENMQAQQWYATQPPYWGYPYWGGAGSTVIIKPHSEDRR